MISFLKKTALAAVLGLGALTAVMPAASAAGMVSGIEVTQAGYRNGFQGSSGDFEQVRDRGWDNRHNRHDRWQPRRDYRGRCAPGLAVEKARRFGLRHARVVDVSPRRVVVAGARYGHQGRMVFANDRGCPTLSR